MDVLLPPLCLLCDEQVNSQGALCSSCFTDITFISDPQCVQCGTPFELAMDEGTRCGDCHAQPPAWRMARSVCRYDDASRKLITRLKYADQTWLARWLGVWLTRAASPLLAQADVIVPVPLHRRRLWWRRYNQAALLAEVLHTQSGVSLSTRLLERVKHTTPQTGLTKQQRARNVRAAFRVRAGKEAEVRGMRIVLVDDVLTTGATLDACARALLKSGAATVDVVTVGRVWR